MTKEMNPIEMIKGIIGSDTTSEGFRTGLNEAVEDKLRQAMIALIAIFTGKGQSGSTLVRSVLRYLDPIRKIPGFSVIGNTLAGALSAQVMKIGGSKIDAKTKLMLADAIKHAFIGSVSGLSEADFASHVDQVVDGLPSPASSTSDSSGYMDPVIISDELSQTYFDVLRDASGQIVYDKDGVPRSTSPVWAEFVARWRREHRPGTKMEGQGKNRKPVPVNGVPAPWDFEERSHAELTKSPCKSTVRGDVVMPTPPALEKPKDTSYASAQPETKAVMKAMNKTLATMRGSGKNMAETTAVYDYLVDLVKDIRNPSLIPDISDVEVMAMDVHPRITSKGLLTFEDLGFMVTALETSGAQLESVRKWKATAAAFFKGKGDDGESVPWTTTIWQLAKKGGYYSAIILGILALPWLLTWIGLVPTSYAAIVLGGLISIVFFLVIKFVTKILEWVVDNITEISLNRNDILDLEDPVRGITHGLLLSTLLSVGINVRNILLNDSYLWIFLLSIAAWALSAWYATVRAQEPKYPTDDQGQTTDEDPVYRIGVVPLSVTAVLVLLVGYFTHLEVARQNATLDMELRWEVTYSPQGAQDNVLVVPLPDGDVILAEDAFGPEVFDALKDACIHPEWDNKDKQRRVKKIGREYVEYLECQTESEDSRVFLPRGKIVEIPGVQVRPIPNGKGYNSFKLISAGIAGPDLPEGDELREWFFGNWLMLLILAPGTIFVICLLMLLFSTDDKRRKGAMIVGGFFLALALVSGGVAYYNLNKGKSAASSSRRGKARKARSSGQDEAAKGLCESWKNSSDPADKADYQEYCQ